MGKPESLIPISGIRELALFRLPPQQCAVCSLRLSTYLNGGNSPESYFQLSHHYSYVLQYPSYPTLTLSSLQQLSSPTDHFYEHE